MELAMDRLASFMAGVQRVEYAGGALRPRRTPESLRALYAGNGELGARADCTACVRLRFMSDSRRVGIKLRFGLPVRSRYLSAIVVDGARCDAFGPVSRQETWQGTIHQQAARQLHLYDLWLPHLCPTDLLGVELEQGCVVERAPALRMRWLAYGDSITQGMT